MLSALLAFLLVPFAAADGMAYRSHKVFVGPEQDLTTEEWALLVETGQTALIDYNNGKEYLSIAISVEKVDAETALWVIPIPAKPDAVNINLHLDIPEFFGDELFNKAGEKIWGFANGMRNTLGLPLIADAFSKISESSVWTMVGGLSSASAKDYAQEGVIVHQQRELFGIEAEIISAESGNAIREYLRTKGLELPQQAAEILDAYVGESYSFLVGRISDYSKFREQEEALNERLIAVGVIFPTDMLYFPLKPTSIYGDKTIPINLYVTGDVSPQLFGGISGKTQVKYYLNEKPDNELQRKFTRIQITAPSSSFTDDLWIDNSAPWGVSIAESVYHNEYVWFVAFLFGVSCLAALLAGNIVFFGKGVKQKVLLFMGAMNTLTIIPFILTVLFWDFKKNRFSGKWEASASERANRRRKGLFIVSFIVIFVILTYAVEAAWGVQPRGHWETVVDKPTNKITCSLTDCTENSDCSVEVSPCPPEAGCNLETHKCSPL